MAAGAVLSRSSCASFSGNRFGVVPTAEYPRPRRASSWLITRSPLVPPLTLANDAPTVRTSGPSAHENNGTATAAFCDDDHIDRRLKSTNCSSSKGLQSRRYPDIGGRI